MKKNREAIGMAPEQTNTYMRAFGGWQRINPSTKLGRPPPDGKPGYNPDLILMDLEKLRSSASFKSYFNERRLNKLIKNYLYHSSADIPSLGKLKKTQLINDTWLQRQSFFLRNRGVAVIFFLPWPRFKVETAAILQTQTSRRFFNQYCIYISYFKKIKVVENWCIDRRPSEKPPWIY